MDQLLERYASIPQRQRFMLAGLIVLGLFALYYVMIYSDQSSRLAALEKQFTDKENARMAKAGVRDNLTRYQDKLALLQTQLEQARAKLPDASDVAQLLAQLGARGEQVGLAIEEFQPRDEVNRGFYSEIPF